MENIQVRQVLWKDVSNHACARRNDYDSAVGTTWFNVMRVLRIIDDMRGFAKLENAMEMAYSGLKCEEIRVLDLQVVEVTVARYVAVTGNDNCYKVTEFQNGQLDCYLPWLTRFHKDDIVTAPAAGGSAPGVWVPPQHWGVPRRSRVLRGGAPDPDAAIIISDTDD